MQNYGLVLCRSYKIEVGQKNVTKGFSERQIGRGNAKMANVTVINQPRPNGSFSLFNNGIPLSNSEKGSWGRG